MIGWAAALAVLAAYLWVPPNAMGRLQPRRTVKLPRWAAPRAGALPSRTRWRLSVLVGVFLSWYVWGWWPPGIGAVPLFVVAGWLGLGRLESGPAARRRQRSREDVPMALDLIRLGLEAGQPVRLAVDVVAVVMGGPVATALDQVSRGVSVGLSDAEAWRSLTGDSVWADVARDFARAADWGVAVTDVLRHHAAALRRESASERLAKAKAVGVKAVAPLGLCYLPAFVLLGVVPVVAGGILRVLQ